MLRLAKKIFPQNHPVPKKFKKMTKYSFIFKFFTRYDWLSNFELSHILGWGLATLSFDRYKIAQTLQGRSCLLCFETVPGMNKITLTTSPPLTPLAKKKLKNFQIFF